MLEVLHSKLTNGILRDDLLWPKFQPRLTVSKPLSKYWLDLEDRYLRSTSSGSLSSSGLADTLPSNWSVLSLHTTPDRDSLVAVRYECGQTPTVLQLPLDRAARRDGEDQLFDLDAAQRELREIIQSANQTSQNAKNVISVEQRREWWTERKALDRRLAALLVNIQDRWLGAYKVGS